MKRKHSRNTILISKNPTNYKSESENKQIRKGEWNRKNPKMKNRRNNYSENDKLQKERRNMTAPKTNVRRILLKHISYAMENLTMASLKKKHLEQDNSVKGSRKREMMKATGDK